MPPIVSLRDVVEAMDFVSGSDRAYLNKITSELATLTSEELAAAEDEIEDDDEYSEDLPEWEREMVDKAREVVASDDYLALPGKFDIHEYSIMERFCRSVDDEVQRADLDNLFRGSGAFGRFKN